MWVAKHKTSQIWMEVSKYLEKPQNFIVYLIQNLRIKGLGFKDFQTLNPKPINNN